MRGDVLKYWPVIAALASVLGMGWRVSASLQAERDAVDRLCQRIAALESITVSEHAEYSAVMFYKGAPSCGE